MILECPFGGLTRVGRYRILNILGRGGMGAVYRAEHDELKREVALKVLTGDLDEDDTLLARFKREAAVAGHLTHPGLVKVFDFDRDKGLWYIAMELVCGPTLLTLIREGKNFGVPECRRIVRELLEAVGALHGAGVIHRDLKPANVMLEQGTRVRVLDLGLVRTEAGTMLTGEGYRVGSPRYMPPEMILEGTSDARTDLWQIGLIAFELITGQSAYPETVVPKLLEQIARDEPPPVPRLPGADGERLRATITGLLKHQVDERFASCADALSALEGRAAAARPRGTGRTPASVAAGAATPRAAQLALGSLAVLGIGLAAAWRAREAPPVEPPRPSLAAEPVATPRAANPDAAWLERIARVPRMVPEFAPPPGGLPDLVRRALDACGNPVRKATFEELRADFPGDRRAARAAGERWSRRLPALLGRPGADAVLRELAAARDQLVPVAVPVEAWTAYLRRMYELKDLARALEQQFDVRTGLVAAELIGGALAPVARLPAGARGVAAAAFGDRGRADGRAEPALPAATLQAPGPMLFSKDTNSVLSGQLGLGVRDEFKTAEFAFPAVTPQRAWLHYRIAGGTPGERLAVRVVDRPTKKYTEVAFLCADAPGEWWMPVDARVMHAPANLRIDHENRSVSYVPAGIALDFLELVVAP